MDWTPAEDVKPITAHPNAGSELPKLEEKEEEEAGTSVLDLFAKDEPRESQSRSLSPAKSSRKTSKHTVQLIGDLPVAREDALKSFTQLERNVYQNKSIGKNQEMMESMTCECIFRHGDDPDGACGPHSDCINRLTQIECMAGDCRTGKHCQNQRFQKKQYGDIEIVLTEKKGFGLRAESSIPKDTFIYEYIGDVVAPTKFKQRMRDYADEGIKHFYFMMLQRDEFIDATKSGGIGRFANHSCNPNCYVAKWTVGDYVRMGIFAKRLIQKHEELTFNYNVDRYGHQAQTCYCGEPNCVGFIGGKTQTDVVTIDDMYLDALGLDEEDMKELKGSKKKKGKKIDDPDFMPDVKALEINDVPKVLTAIRTSGSKKIISKLLTRIKLCVDEPTLFSVLRLRGFSVMYNLLAQNKDDMGLLSLVLETMSSWPLLTRNKVDASKVPELVKDISEREGDKEDLVKLREQAIKLLEQWDQLKLGFRIAKRVLPVCLFCHSQSSADLDQPPEEPASPASSSSGPHKKHKKRKYALTPQMEAEKREREALKEALLRRSRAAVEEMQRASMLSSVNIVEPILVPPPAPVEKIPVHVAVTKEQRKSLISQITKQKEEEEQALRDKQKQEEEERKARREKREKRKLEKERRKNMSEEEKEVLKEKRLLKLVGGVVVKCMSKYQKQMSTEQFKKYAKELTQTIAEKEKKSSSYKANKLEALSPEKVEKIKKFAKEYITKLMRKLNEKKKAKRKSRHPDTPESSSNPGSLKTEATPADDIDGDGDVTMADDAPPPMSVEEAMDLDGSDSDSKDAMDLVENSLAPPKSAATSPPLTATLDEDMDPPESTSTSPSSGKMEFKPLRFGTTHPSSNASSDPRRADSQRQEKNGLARGSNGIAAHG
ncbi:histone-lysine N-methyltransferase [Flagelloscypha sp. PMI_526]|nr:histone-lysine N-methyltransferase [Flagelloscypha sp. PMI_526]